MSAKSYVHNESSVLSASSDETIKTPTKPTKVSNAVAQLTTQDHIELREAFEFIDKSGDGSVGPDELRIVLEAIGNKMTLEQA